ncbi:DUF397 domain-containing protein [Saccharopolyspora cebuensis]|uniref:DUF397 domain-containing protein n=1 Tax=Saccharopolyspora cebuensis TaxID=418759 RepID=A0ABV4CKX2_9PSEU
MTVEHEPENWRKASRSQNGSACVEVGRVADGAAVRDTKNRATGYFTTTGPQWAAFLGAIKTGRYDR